VCDCRKVRAHFPKVDRLITEMKKTFLKCPKRIAIFNDKCPIISNPPNPNEIKSPAENFNENVQCVNIVKDFF